MNDRHDFVGRAPELTAFEAALASLVGGAGGVLILAGEPGIGKTRIAREAVGHVEAHRMTVGWGACYEGERARPYGVWTEALTAVVRQIGTLAVDARVGAVLSAILPGLASTRPAALGAGDEQLRLFEAVIDLLAATARPVLVLDDLQWADADSLALLRRVARAARSLPVLVVAIHRDPDPALQPGQPLSDTLAALQREAVVEHYTLHGLALPEVERYLSQTGGPAVPAALAGTLLQHTGGNPFYLGEALRFLVAEGRIIDRSGRWWTEFSLAELGIPPSVRQVVGQRLTRLNPSARQALVAASALSAPCSFTLLQAVTGLPDDRLLDALDEALAAGLLRPADGGGYTLSHAIVRQTVSDTLNPDRQARLHRQVATALEAQPAGAGRDNELAVQYHASRSLPGAERGISFALAAADQARSAAATQQAAANLRLARDLAVGADPVTRSDVLARLALAEAEAGQIDAAVATATMALDSFAHASMTAPEVAGFLAAVARSLRDAGARQEIWSPLVERGLALTADRRDLTWARLALLVHRSEPVAGGAIHAQRWLGYDPQALEIVRAEGSETDIARTLEPVEWSSRQETDAVLALARTWQEPRAILRALSVVTNNLFARHGALSEAAARAEELHAVAERHGAIPEQVEGLCQLAIVRYAEARFDQAARTSDRARARLVRLGPDHLLQSWNPWLDFFHAVFLEGDWEAIARRAAGWLDDRQAPGAAMALIFGGMAAVAWARAGDAPAARRALGALVPALGASPPNLYTVNLAVSLAGMAAWDLDATEAASPLRDRARAQIAAGVGEPPLCCHALVIARADALLGDLIGARAAFAEARNRLEAAGQRALRPIVDYDEALTLRRLAPANRREALALLDEATSAFQALGMDGWAARASRQRAAIEPAAGPAGGLTRREVEVLRLIAAGLTDKEIADRLVLSVLTVHRHVANVYAKIGARGRAEATAYALGRGVAPLPPA